MSNDRELMKTTLNTLVDVHGARAVAEELVEVLHDRADYVRRTQRDDCPRWENWRRIGCKLGNAVHWQNLVWPS